MTRDAKPCHAEFNVRLTGAEMIKVTIEVTDAELAEILDLTGECEKGPAVRHLVEMALQRHRSDQDAQRSIRGEWGVELQTYEADRDRESHRD